MEYIDEITKYTRADWDAIEKPLDISMASDCMRVDGLVLLQKQNVIELIMKLYNNGYNIVYCSAVKTERDRLMMCLYNLCIGFGIAYLRSGELRIANHYNVNENNPRRIIVCGPMTAMHLNDSSVLVIDDCFIGLEYPDLVDKWMTVLCGLPPKCVIMSNTGIDVNVIAELYCGNITCEWTIDEHTNQIISNKLRDQCKYRKMRNIIRFKREMTEKAKEKLNRIASEGSFVSLSSV